MVADQSWESCKDCWQVGDGYVSYCDKHRKSSPDDLECKPSHDFQRQLEPKTIFIKLDETTEAFQQTHVALEILKSFQKDHRELLERFHRCKQEYAREVARLKEKQSIEDRIFSETNAKMERYENALKIIADDIDLDTHISKKKIAREALGMTP